MVRIRECLGYSLLRLAWSFKSDNQFVGATVEDDVAFGLENKGTYEEMASRVQRL